MSDPVRLRRVIDIQDLDGDVYAAAMEYAASYEASNHSYIPVDFEDEDNEFIKFVASFGYTEDDDIILNVWW